MVVPSWLHGRGRRRLHARRVLGARQASPGRRADRRRRRGRARHRRPRAEPPRGGRGRRRDAGSGCAGERDRTGLPRPPLGGPRRRRDERWRRLRRRAPPRGPAGDRRDPAALGRPGGERDRQGVLLSGLRDRRAGGLPRTRPAARHARPARGVPPRSRRAVRPRLRAGRDAEPVHALQRRLSLRRAARVRSSRRRCTARHGALRTDPRAPRPALARPCRRRAEGPVVHARPPRPREARPDLVPARRPDQDRDARAGRRGRARRRRAARRARRRASSPGTTTGSSSSGAASR